MAKKTKKKSGSLKPKAMNTKGKAPMLPEGAVPQGQGQLPPEMQKKLADLKKKLDKFKDKVLDKFGDYIIGITVLPPPQAPPKGAQAANPNSPTTAGAKAAPGAVPIQTAGQPANIPGAPQAAKKKLGPDDIEVLVLVDDTTSKKMTKDELHHKFSSIIKDIAKEVDKKIIPQALLLTDLWQNYYDGKNDLSRLIAMAAPIFDTGMLAAIKISEIHKNMVIRKFEKYILSYVLAGSLTQGRNTQKSDIDVWIVIDDTDVKKMSRLELKEKLRAIIIGMGAEAGQLTGIKNKLNIQVYILTDFWDSLKEANPIIFTLLRDGVPLYDKGIFMPWKQLLRMGKIKPSRESIDIFMNSGEQMKKRINAQLKAIGMEDLYYATLTPTQAAIMLYGLPPPTPKETPDVLEEIFVKKEKMLEKKWVNILRYNTKVRKDLEHGDKKAISGSEIDKMLKDTEDYLKRIKDLFKQIEEMHDKNSIMSIYDETITIIRDILKLEGVQKSKESEILKIFENELIQSGKVPQRYLKAVKEIVNIKTKLDKGKITKTDIQKTRKNSGSLIRFLVDYLQLKRGRQLERAKIRVKHGSKFAEITLLEKEAFIIRDIDARDGNIEKAPINKDGSIGTAKKSSYEEFEKALAGAKLPNRVFIKEPIFEDIKTHFGKDAEILIHNF